MAEATHDEGANDAQVTAERYRLLVGGLSVIIAILLGLAMLAPSFVHSRVPLTAAGALAVITGGSLAIERLIEIIWTLIDLTKATGWPSGVHLARIEAFLASLKQILAEAKQTLKDAKAEVGTVKARIDSITKVLDQLEKVAGSSFPGTQNAFVRVHDALNELSKLLGQKEKAASSPGPEAPEGSSPGDIPSALDTASKELDALSSLVDAVSANPARRLFSILLGLVFGLFGAWVLGLDVHSAVNAPTGTSSGQPDAWVAVTGLVMGLGPTPTHELISFLQKRKDATPAAASAAK